jgi:hypothetical protein
VGPTLLREELQVIKKNSIQCDQVKKNYFVGISCTIKPNHINASLSVFTKVLNIWETMRWHHKMGYLHLFMH